MLALHRLRPKLHCHAPGHLGRAPCYAAPNASIATWWPLPPGHCWLVTRLLPVSTSHQPKPKFHLVTVGWSPAVCLYFRLYLHFPPLLQGCSYRVEKCWVVTRSGTSVDLSPNLDGVPAAAATFTPSHMERIVTRSSGAAAGRRPQTQVSGWGGGWGAVGEEGKEQEEQRTRGLQRARFEVPVSWAGW